MLNLSEIALTLLVHQRAVCRAEKGQGHHSWAWGTEESGTTDTQTEACVQELPPKLYLAKYPSQGE